jgi:hypothetical protein
MQLLKSCPLPRSALFANNLADAFQLPSHLLVGCNNLVESIRHLAFQAGPGVGQSDRKVPVSHLSQCA